MTQLQTSAILCIIVRASCRCPQAWFRMACPLFYYTSVQAQLDVTGTVCLPLGDPKTSSVHWNTQRHLQFTGRPNDICSSLRDPIWRPNDICSSLADLIWRPNDICSSLGDRIWRPNDICSSLGNPTISAVHWETQNIHSSHSSHWHQSGQRILPQELLRL